MDLREVAEAAGAAGLSRVLNDYPNCRTEPLVRSVKAARVRELESLSAARGRRVSHSLTSYWRIDVRSLEEPLRLLERLRQTDAVAHAYQELRRTDPAVNPSDDPFAIQQAHLNAAPVGIDARWMWGLTHGSGATVGFVDVEQGWTFNHEDVPPIVTMPGVGRDVNSGHESHGTAVLGIVAGVDNTTGIIGIAPTPAWVSVASHYRMADDTEGHVVDAIESVLASGQLSEGDVLLLEVTSQNKPIELDEGVRVAIETATGLGYIVVECAGNGNEDLDALPAFNASSVDSWAIIVGAGMSTLDATGVGHERWILLPPPGPGSNYGARVDCYAYGENVVTAGPTKNPAGALGQGTGPTDDYRRDFGGTSAAAAIVAGAAVLLQGLHKAVKGIPLTPQQMRDALRNFGTPQVIGRPGHIGVMPDLRKAAAGLALVPQSTGSPPTAPTGLRIAR
jgi:hypothetical protein